MVLFERYSPVKKYMSFIVSMLLVSFAVADTRPILLVTPKGVYQAEVVDGVPGPWKSTDLDVIIQGFTVGGGPNTTPPDNGPPVVTPPNPVDPTVTEVARLSKSILKDTMEATAVAALIDALQKTNVEDGTFTEALEMAMPIADASLKSEGRLVKWREAVIKVTSSAAVMKAGLQQSFGIGSNQLTEISNAAFAEGTPVPEQAMDMIEIIKLIQLILDLLRNLGILKGI